MMALGSKQVPLHVSNIFKHSKIHKYPTAHQPKHQLPGVATSSACSLRGNGYSKGNARTALRPQTCTIAGPQRRRWFIRMSETAGELKTKKGGKKPGKPEEKPEKQTHQGWLITKKKAGKSLQTSSKETHNNKEIHDRTSCM